MANLSSENKFKYIYKHFNKKVMKDCLAFNQLYADDMFNQAMLRIYKYVDNIDLDNISHPSYIMRLVFNSNVEFENRYLKRKKDADKNSIIDMSEISIDNFYDDGEVDDNLKYEELKDTIMMILNNKTMYSRDLSKEQMIEAYIDYYIEGFSIKELNDKWGLPLTTFKSWLWNTNNYVKNELKKLGY